MRTNCDDVAGTLKFASDSLLEGLLDESLQPPINRTTSDDWVALVHTFFAILHPNAVQRLLNLDNDDIQVDLLLCLCSCGPWLHDIPLLFEHRPR